MIEKILSNSEFVPDIVKKYSTVADNMLVVSVLWVLVNSNISFN